MTPRRLAVVLVLALPLVIGCAPGAKVVGTWDMKTETPEPGGSGIGGTYVPPAILNALKPKLNIEFKHDGSYAVEAYAGGEKETGKGKWKYVKTEKDVTRLKVQKDGGAEKEIQMRFINHNSVEMPLPPVGDDDDWGDDAVTFARRDF